MATAKKRTKKGVPVAAIAAGVAAAGAAAAAGYYFYGAPKAKQHRRKAAVWAKKMQRDVVREAKKLEDVSEEAVAAVVAQTARAYKGAKGVDIAELQAVANELKANWKSIQKEAKGVARRTTGAKKAPAKKRSAAKKTAKKR